MLSPEHQSTRVSKIKNGGLDQYGAGPFKQQQFGTAGVEGVNSISIYVEQLNICTLLKSTSKHTCSNSHKATSASVSL